LGLEKMIVIEAAERALHHRIAKVIRPREPRNFTGEVLPDSEVLASPSHLLAQLQQSEPTALVERK
jgi:hypothetical protein